MKSTDDVCVDDLDESLNGGQELDLKLEPHWLVSRKGLMWHFEAMVGTLRPIPEVLSTLRPPGEVMWYVLGGSSENKLSAFVECLPFIVSIQVLLQN